MPVSECSAPNLAVRLLVAMTLVLVVGCRQGDRTASASGAAMAATPAPPPALSTKTYAAPSLEERKARLSPLEYDVTQHAATEPPFHNRFWDNHERGLYVDVVTGEPLFSSTDKFDSGTGWPSFTRPVAPTRVVRRDDSMFGMTRTEVRSRAGDSHLGHVFDDGPAPTGLRYCINSAALRFIPVERLQAEGYGEYRVLFGGAPQPQASPGRETAILAGGCFWGMQEILRGIPGVLDTEAGYSGGKLPSPTYEDVHTGVTSHAEAVRVVFDPTTLSYEDLLEKWFFRMHDPTTKNRQGNDVGSQYRSAIFFMSDAQRVVAERVKARGDASGKWQAPIVTEIVAAGPFTPAEEDHQDYLQKHPGGYTCHYLRE